MAKKTSPFAVSDDVEVDYDRDVKPFDDSPSVWTDDEIAREIAGQTLAPIDRVTGKAFFGNVDWWYLADREGEYSGEFESIRDNPGTPAAVRQTLNRFWQIVFAERSLTMETSLRQLSNGDVAPQQFSGDVRQVLEWYVDNFNGTATPEENQSKVDEFYTLGIGLKYPVAPSATAVATARDEAAGSAGLEETRQRLAAQNQALENQYLAPVLQSDDPNVLTDANMKQAHTDIAANWVDGS